MKFFNLMSCAGQLFSRESLNFIKEVLLNLLRAGADAPDMPNGNEPEPLETTGESRSADGDMLRRLQEFILSQADLRFNLLTEQAEYRRKDGHEEYQVVDKRMMNSLTLDARLAGISCWDRDVSRLLASDRLPDYHPMLSYMQSLPEWDGTDRVTPLALRISDNELWINGFHRWMRAMAAQWMGHDMVCANALAPILVSQRQGLRKSTFCRMLVPDSLACYYTDRFDIGAQSNNEQRLATTALINMDEFDRYRPTQMASLKNLMQMKASQFRKLHTSRFLHLPRMASFIGTSNSFDLLCDPTGSRRFLCVEVDHTIDCTTLEHKQIYAQLRHEILEGLPTFLTRDEEASLEQNNHIFYRSLPVIEVLEQHFRLPHSGEEPQQFHSTQLLEFLRRQHPSVMRDVSVRSLSEQLLTYGVKRRHTKSGNVFLLVQKEEE